MVTGSEGTNKIAHICPYLEIRTQQAGGVFNYVATRLPKFVRQRAARAATSMSQNKHRTTAE